MSRDITEILKGRDHRLARALRWRLSAYQKNQKLGNLLRPTPENRIVSPSATPTPVVTSKLAPSPNAVLAAPSKPREVAQYRFRWGASYFDLPVRENVVFYESFSGNGTLCNPFAIFEYLLNDPTKKNYQHIWSIRDDEERKAFNAEYARYGNVKAVKYETDAYWREICTAQYLVNNATFPPYFSKRPGQVYVNTWHGTPLKTMGYHSNEGAFGARNILRNFVQADYLVSANAHTTNTMYRDAYRLQGIFAGQVIEQGHPRTDAQFVSDARKDRTREQLVHSGIALSGKPVVLYAPTWKGSSFQAPVNEANQLLNRIRNLELNLGHKYDFILKVHQQVYAQAIDLPELRKYLVPNRFPANEILSLVDTLITDYSSIFFDFLATKKPVIFFTPDHTDYLDSRGVYLDTLPGPCIHGIEELVETLENAGLGGANDFLLKFESSIERAQEEYCSRDDGLSTARVVSIVFDGNPGELPTITDFKTSKESMLLYLGGMRNNGITTSALNLLNNIDYSKYDVSIWAPQKSKDSPAFLYERIPSEVRQFLRQGSHPLTEDRHNEMNKFIGDSDFSSISIPKKPNQVFAAEWYRCFGSSTFDYVIDFSGYAGYWSFVLAQAPSTKSRSVWQHNDLISDRDREVNGKKPNYTSLTSQFNSYRFFDNIVSVSEDLKEINKMNLGGYAHREAFKSCRNTVDVAKVERALMTTGDANFAQQIDSLTDINDLTGIVDRLLVDNSAESLRSIIDKRERHKHLFASKGVVRFVTAGRMSPEKNQARLLNAFAKVHAAKPDTELILLGDGALRKDLEKLAAQLGIQDVVFFAGMVDDPLEIMKDCDCFVLSSDYEGQPMVILEASSVGIPVITVAFASVRNSLGLERGMIVEQSVASLANGMLDFVEGRVLKEISFDYNEYNKTVMNEFYRAIGAAS